MSIEEFCKQNKKKVHFSINKKLLKEANSMLDSNEEVLYAVMFQQALTPKILVVTSKRIYTCQKVISTASEILYLKDITSIDNLKGAGLLQTTGGLIIRGNSQSIEVVGFNISFVTDDIRNVILKAKENLEDTNTIKQNSNLNYLEELEKLADLKEKGILSKEEFNTKKQQILDSNK